MLADTIALNQGQQRWQAQLKAASLTVGELLAELQFPAAEAERLLASIDIAADFPLRVPPALRQRMQRGNSEDPLLRQILPLLSEQLESPGFSQDPLEERRFNPAPGLIHKYRSRALLTASPNCAIHCRYCFRRHFPYGDNSPSRSDWQQSFDYLRQHPEINELILSGGDPLFASDRQLAWLAEQLAEIESIQRLRIHTRLPVVIPERICNELLAWLSAWPRQKIIVLHCNHAAELGPEHRAMVNDLRAQDIYTLNQSVLLKGVNDDAATLAELSEALFDHGILPYYLHLLDKVQGAQHFLVDDQRALAIYRDLRGRLPGFLLPKLVREQAGANSKTPLAEN